MNISLYKLDLPLPSESYFSGRWIDGTNMTLLEQKLQQYLDVPYVILTSSGTTALLAAYWVLKAYSRTLIVDPYTFPASYQTARVVGYEVQFKRLLLRDTIAPRSDAVHCFVHLFGQPDLNVINSAGGIVVEDAAQAFGASISGTKVGTIGEIGCFSFYPTKVLHTCGHGGAVVTRNPELYEAMKLFIECGRKNGEMTEAIGLNLRMDEIKAEFLLQKLDSYESELQRRRTIASCYMEVINEPQPFVTEKADSVHAYSVFNLLVSDRDEFIKFMTSRGIETKIYYDRSILPVELREDYRDITDHVVCIPCRHNLADEEIEYIRAALKYWFSGALRIKEAVG